jgi:hypothetical protein
MKLFIFLSRRCSAGSWRHQDDTGTVAPRKPTSSWAPADRKALARSRLMNGKDLLRTSAAPRPRNDQRVSSIYLSRVSYPCRTPVILDTELREHARGEPVRIPLAGPGKLDDLPSGRLGQMIALTERPRAAPSGDDPGDGAVVLGLRTPKF